MTDALDEALHVQWQSATIDRIERRTPRVKSFFLRPPRWQRFLAGQHVDIRLTAPDGYQVQRTYSIASPPQLDGIYEIVVERLDDGEVSPFLHEVAEVGDEIEIRGPFGGHFVWTPEDYGPLLLVGGGSGVAPLLSIVRHHAAVGSAEPLMLLCSARTWDDVIYREDLIARGSSKGTFAFLLHLTREAAHRPEDASGRIDRKSLELAITRLGAAPQMSFVCGSNPFVEAITGFLVDLGLVSKSIRAERFGG